MKKTDTNTTEQKSHIGIPLTLATVEQAGKAVMRLVQLQGQSILTRDTEGEKQALEIFLQSILTQHANELIGSWLVLHKEYTPLLEGVAALMRRVNATNEIHARRAAAMLAAQQQPAVNGAGLICSGVDPAVPEKDSAVKTVITPNFGEATQTGAPVDK